MKLLRIEVENFGKLSGFSLDTEDGLNLLCEKNGWGKSTLAVFIKALLYGLPATRAKDTDKNERKKYTPWQGGSYGGSIEFESDKGRFRVERFFGAKEANDEFRLFDLSTNKPSTAYSSELGIELFGIDAEGFERSTYLSQRAISPSDGNDSVTAKLTGLLDDVNDIGNFDVAMNVIDKRRQFYELKGGRGRVSDLKNDYHNAKDELERCKALLPTQRDLENRRAKIKQELINCEQELGSVREIARKAELRLAREEESQRMLERIQKDEAHRREILQNFREQSLPTDAELKEHRDLLSECRREQVNAARYRLTDEEATRLGALAARFPNGIPRADVLDRAQENVEALARVRAELRTLDSTVPESRELAYFRKLGEQIPSQALLDSATEALERVERLRARQQAEQTADSKKSIGKSPRVLQVLLLAGGGLLAALGILISSLLLPFLILGGALVAAGVVWLLVGAKNTNTVATHRQNDLQMQKEQALGYVRGILERYRIALPENGDLRAPLNELILLARTAHRDEIQAKQRESELQKRHAYLSELQRRVNEFFLASGFPEPPKEAGAALRQIRDDRTEYTSLFAKKTGSEKKLAEIENGLREKQARIAAFLSQSTVHTRNLPEERLSKMEQLCAEHAKMLGSIGQQRKEHAAFLQEYRLNEAVSYPSKEELEAKETEWKERETALRDEEIAVKRQLDRTLEQTQRIPELEDETVNLKTALLEAQGNLSLLKHTAEFLADAKEALSTRYLEGIRTHFQRYRAMLEGEEAPRADIDTDFNVSVTVGGKSRESEYFSRGSRDMMQFCARLALIRAMFEEGEAPFLLLDDPFVNLDEDNLASARALLEALSEEFQILYFICHTGRM